MATVYDIEANEFIEEVVKDFSKDENMKAPDWASFVKTGMSKDRPPIRTDWWIVRAAAILRTIYRSKGPIGVQKLRIKYGSKKNRGHKPEKFYRSSGKIIRVILQQLEKSELIKKADSGVHKGRVISPKGKSFLDKIASRIVRNAPKKTIKKEEKNDAPVKEKETPKAEEKKAPAEKKETPKEEPKSEEKKEETNPAPKEKTDAPVKEKEAPKEEKKEAPKAEEKPVEEEKEAPKEESKPEENKNE